MDAVKTFRVEYFPAEEGGFVATVPELRGAVTQGDDFDDLKYMAKDCIEGWLECCGHPDLAKEFAMNFVEVAPTGNKVGKIIKTFRVEWYRDEDGVLIASVPQLKGAHTYGVSLDNLEDMAKECIECTLDAPEPFGMVFVEVAPPIDEDCEFTYDEPARAFG